jgi:hypothetical protein
MKPNHLPAGIAILVVAVTAWYVLSADEKQPTTGRAGSAQGPATSEPTSIIAPISTTNSSEAPRPERDLEKELADAQARIDELTNTVAELTDAWNQFASQEHEKRRKASMRGWGPEQAVGAPDCKGAGDQQTAWASQQADGGPEWLETTYGTPVQIAGVRVLENDNPGAITKITAVLDGGAEVVLWEGIEPKAAAPADQYFAARGGVLASKVRVHMDTSKVPGWNEIDAVELIGMDGTRQWAQSANASSTYASSRGTLQETVWLDTFGRR